METFLGFLGLVAWVVVTIGLASSLTWLIVRIFPAERGRKESPPEPSA